MTIRETDYYPPVLERLGYVEFTSGWCQGAKKIGIDALGYFHLDLHEFEPSQRKEKVVGLSLQSDHSDALKVRHQEFRYEGDDPCVLVLQMVE